MFGRVFAVFGQNVEVTDAHVRSIAQPAGLHNCGYAGDASTRRRARIAAMRSAAVIACTPFAGLPMRLGGENKF